MWNFNDLLNMIPLFHSFSKMTTTWKSRDLLQLNISKLLWHKNRWTSLRLALGSRFPLDGRGINFSITTRINIKAAFWYISEHIARLQPTSMDQFVPWMSKCWIKQEGISMFGLYIKYPKLVKGKLQLKLTFLYCQIVFEFRRHFCFPNITLLNASFSK